MTEFEINEKVAEKLKLNTIAYERTEIVLFDDMDATPFDPCNNVEQAWEIMLSYGITIVFQKGKYQFATIDGEIEIKHKKPLVSAMLCFLEIDK